jgi:tetratricopeptide (TPR) repeat protein
LANLVAGIHTRHPIPNTPGGTSLSEKDLEAARSRYQEGKRAFERGQYRQAVEALEASVDLTERASRFGGEVQIWLATAYEAAGQQQNAIALCEQLSRHPDMYTRKQGSRLLYILKAPKLRIHPEWVTQIPDLQDLAEGESRIPTVPVVEKKSRRKKSEPEDLPPIDWSQINTSDNQFIWVALGAIALLCGWLFWNF